MATNVLKSSEENLLNGTTTQQKNLVFRSLNASSSSGDVIIGSPSTFSQSSSTSVESMSLFRFLSEKLEYFIISSEFLSFVILARNKLMNEEENALSKSNEKKINLSSEDFVRNESVKSGGGWRGLFSELKNGTKSSRNISGIFAKLLFLVVLIQFLDYGYAHEYNPSSSIEDSGFSRRTLIRPKLQNGRHKQYIKSTHETDGQHATNLILTYDHNGRNVIIDLNINHNLIPKGHFLRYQTPNGGDDVVKTFTKTDVDLCHYQGVIRGNKESRVAVSTCNGINGIVFDGKNTYHIQSGADGKIHSDHYIYDHADMTHNATCGYSRGIDHLQKHNSRDSEFNRILRYKRSAQSDAIIRGPYNSNKDSAYVEMLIVIDNRVYKSLGANLTKMHQYSKDLANIMNSLYVPLNIFIALVGVIVWTESNAIELSKEGDKTLTQFLNYRKKIIKDHPNDNAQLLTKEQFEDGVVGKALKGPICTFEYSGGVSMDHSPIKSVVATTMAHELGHNFGMEHDTDDCKCPEERCIMSSSSSSISPKHWSSCSIDQLNLAFHHGMNYCLKNKPAKLFESSVCGNGFVENGEQCDCGLPELCTNTCCNAKTCMLFTNASCATGECCDLNTCRPRSAGYECRGAATECDLAEYCTGESEYCPKDFFKRDTESCGSGKAYCFEGSCRSHSDQCKVLWGLSGASSEQCYSKNIEGNVSGNCGYNKLTSTYTKCNDSDVMCGMLHCKHLNERLEFGMESVAKLAHTFISHLKNVIPCRTAIVDLGLEVKDPGMTPDGAKCGDGKMCVDQKCVAISELRIAGVGAACPDQCNGNGVCNNKGHCHCDLGFAPPDCRDPGSGGSVDSGPSSKIQEDSGFVRVLLIFFFGVIPTMSIIAFIIYYYRQNLLLPGGSRKGANVFLPNNKQSPSRPPPAPPAAQPVTTPGSFDDMNSALLKTVSEEPTMINNNMFGKFQGFTLKPLQKDPGPVLSGTKVAYVHPVTKSTAEDSSVPPNRSAPPVPKPPSIGRSQTQHRPTAKVVNRTNTTVLSAAKMFETAPALPPLNPGANPRPLISNPILEASTCSAKELMSPLKNSNAYPVRVAPIAPPVPKHSDPLSVKFSNSNSSLESEKKGGTLQKIASFLKKDNFSSSDKKTATLPRNPSTKRSISIDREKLKNIEISAPIPNVESSTELDAPANRVSLNRTQSMRDPVSPTRPNIHTFGSMRHPANLKRPKSFVGTRPTSPPPPRPPAPIEITGLKIPGVPGYQNPPAPKKVIIQNDYDDCEAIEAPLAHVSEENSPTGDNIYAVIDESTPASIPPAAKTDNLGLLGEIVSEIENRNFDSIYSAATLKKKKKGAGASTTTATDGRYENTSDINDDTESEYSNMNPKSNASTTSSGYLRPSAINTPIARVAPTKPDISGYSTPASTFSSFRTAVPPVDNNNTTNTDDNKSTYKPYSAAFSRAGPIASTYKNTIHNKDEKPPSQTTTAATTTTTAKTKPILNRNKTPPQINSLRTRSPSPKSQKPAVTKPLAATKNTDLVSSTKTSSTPSKPKTPQKPTLAHTNSKLENNKFTATHRQNSGDKLKTTKSGGLNNKTTSDVKNSKLNGNNNETTTTKPLNSNANTNNSSNATNKMLTNASRPQNGRASNVASLQQKFESGTNKITTAAAKK